MRFSCPACGYQGSTINDEQSTIQTKLDHLTNALREARELNTSILERLFILATLADLDAAIAAQNTEIQTLSAAITQVDSDVTTLIAKAAAANVPADFTAELEKIKTNTGAIASAVSSAQGADASANPPPVVAPTAAAAAGTPPPV